MKNVWFLLFVFCSGAWSGSAPLLEDTLDLSVGQYRSVRFRVLQVQGTDTRISGVLAVTPDTARVEALLLSSDGYARWRSTGLADTLAYLEARSGPFHLEVPRFGDYVLLFSNRGNFHPVRVTVEARLHFQGDGIPYDTLPTAFRLMLILLAAGVAVAAILLALRRLKRE